MTKINNLNIIIDNLKNLIPDDLSTLNRPRKRLTELMLKILEDNKGIENEKKLFIHFLRSPLKIENLAENNNKLNRLSLGINEFVDDKYSESSKVKLTDKIEHLDFDLLLRSIGYKAISIDKEIPINERTGIIENELGLIKSMGNDVFCSGWAATGAQGVILGTMNSSFEIGRNILKHIENGAIDLKSKPGRDAIIEILNKQNVRVITFEDWQKIDNLEQEVGKKKNKPREKIVNISEILEYLDKN